MKEHLQVKQFAEYSSDNEQTVNKFLKEMGSRVVSVTPLYNTILGGIQYVVVYWRGRSEQLVCEYCNDDAKPTCCDSCLESMVNAVQKAH